ncbi:hypothetical protein QTV49_004649 [Vibrio vulnificus]|nr:hypothetical protein [Vibrio vulnificus]
MIEKRILSLVAARAICDFVKGKDGEQEIKVKVKKYIQSIDLKNGEALVMSKLDDVFFDGGFVPFVGKSSAASVLSLRQLSASLLK